MTNRSEVEALDASTSTMSLSLASELYPRDVLYAAAYVFLDRAYILLDRQADRYVVHFRGKRPLEEATLTAMAGEFENELLAQALRARVSKANQNIIEGITALAISGATAGDPVASDPTMLDMAKPGGDGFLEDPLGLGAPLDTKKGAE